MREIPAWEKLHNINHQQREIEQSSAHASSSTQTQTTNLYRRISSSFFLSSLLCFLGSQTAKPEEGERGEERNAEKPYTPFILGDRFVFRCTSTHFFTVSIPLIMLNISSGNDEKFRQFISFLCVSFFTFVWDFSIAKFFLWSQKAF